MSVYIIAYIKGVGSMFSSVPAAACINGLTCSEFTGYFQAQAYPQH